MKWQIILAIIFLTSSVLAISSPPYTFYNYGSLVTSATEAEQDRKAVWENEIFVLYFIGGVILLWVIIKISAKIRKTNKKVN